MYSYYNTSEHLKQCLRNLYILEEWFYWNVLSFHGLLKPLYAKSGFLSTECKISYFKGRLNYTVIKNLFALYPPPLKKIIIDNKMLSESQ